jgi:myosin heavy subunit
MIGSSSLVYAWQNTQINGNVAVQERNVKIEQLSLQVEQLTAQSKLDKATLQTQQEQIAQKNDLLKAVEQDLNNATQQLKDAQSQLTKQKDQLATNSTELEQLRNRPPLFNFKNQSSLADIESKEAAIKEVVTAAYTYIQDLYDKPYLLNTITITFVDNFSIAGASGEIEISNSAKGISINIHIKDFDKNSFEDVNTIIHEIMHGFHGVAVLDSSALEEGMVVAASDAVMATMIKDKKLPSFERLYLILNEAQYSSYNDMLSIRSDNTKFYQDPLISRVYQLIGTAWYKLYNADPSFFKKFNVAYYAKVQQGLTVDAAEVRAIIASIIPEVEGLPINQFLSQNRAFNPS